MKGRLAAWWQELHAVVSWSKAVEKALNQSLAALLKMREREGAHLAKDLTSRIGIMHAAVDKIQKQAPTMAENYRQNLIERIKSAGIENIAPKVQALSETIQRWLALQGRLCLVYLPTYSGHRLNPVEKVWWALKGNIAANRAFRNLAELDAAIHGYFADFPPARVLALINCKLVRQAQMATLQTA